MLLWFSIVELFVSGESQYPYEGEERATPAGDDSEDECERTEAGLGQDQTILRRVPGNMPVLSF